MFDSVKYYLFLYHLCKNNSYNSMFYMNVGFGDVGRVVVSVVKMEDEMEKEKLYSAWCDGHM